MNPGTIASVTTAAGTLVLAVATFSATRSANRASRVAERSLLAALRPVLMHAHLSDPRQKIGFVDQHWVHVEGPSAVFEEGDGAIYLAFGLRNAGSGIAVLQGWYPIPERTPGAQEHAPAELFRAQSRALYIPAGGLGFWQGALRDPSEQLYADFAAAAANRQPVLIDLLYTDMNGGQRTITRMSMLPAGEDRWVASIGRHWMLDQGDRPRRPRAWPTARSGR